MYDSAETTFGVSSHHRLETISVHQRALSRPYIREGERWFAEDRAFRGASMMWECVWNFAGRVGDGGLAPESMWGGWRCDEQGVFGKSPFG